MMRTRFGRAAALLAGAALALGLLAGCGSSGSGGASTQGTTHAGSSSGSSGGAVTIGTTTGPDGTYLVDGSGMSLYLWVADKNGKSTCSGACASAWPPLTTNGTPKATGKAQSSDIGTVSRSDGTKQVTYHGHPLYYFVSDKKPGDTTGQGDDGFGAKWWLVDPAGDAITTTSSGS